MSARTRADRTEDIKKEDNKVNHVPIPYKTSGTRQFNKSKKEIFCTLTFTGVLVETY
jgi:hypothetical protein